TRRTRGERAAAGLWAGVPRGDSRVFQRHQDRGVSGRRWKRRSRGSPALTHSAPRITSGPGAWLSNGRGEKVRGVHTPAGIRQLAGHGIVARVFRRAVYGPGGVRSGERRV